MIFKLNSIIFNATQQIQSKRNVTLILLFPIQQ